LQAPTEASRESTQVVIGALLATLAILVMVVLRPFLASITWAGILAYVSWPVRQKLFTIGQRARGLSALMMTLALTAIVAVPMLWLVSEAREEITAAYRGLGSELPQIAHRAAALAGDVPWVGRPLAAHLERYSADLSSLASDLGQWAQQWSHEIVAVVGGVSRNLAKLLITLVTLFFVYRDADRWTRQLQQITARYLGRRLDPYLTATARMIRAVVYGLLIAAVLQGAIAGVGYWLTGLGSPVLLGTLTGIASLIPVIGTVLIWGPCAVWLIAQGHLWAGVGLLAWGAALVHPIDNVLRPLVISDRTRTPFLLVLFGAAGGISAFGLVGAFVGPVILSIAVAAWREWTTAAQAST
jgi:predicted PurR-regulated permease PerM